MAHTWKKDEVITSELMNDLETRADKTGSQGPKGETGKNGENGVSVSALELIKDDKGAITGGTATLSDGKTLAITVK